MSQALVILFTIVKNTFQFDFFFKFKGNLFVSPNFKINLISMHTFLSRIIQFEVKLPNSLCHNHKIKNEYRKQAYQKKSNKKTNSIFVQHHISYLTLFISNVYTFFYSRVIKQKLWVTEFVLHIVTLMQTKILVKIHINAENKKIGIDNETISNNFYIKR